VGLDIAVNGQLQFLDAVKYTTPDTPLRQQTEPALHQVGPGGGSGDEVELKARMLFQPAFHVLVAMVTGVVENDVDVQAGRGLLVEPAQQAEELPIAVAGVALSQHLARAHVVGGKQGRSAVPFVVMSMGPALSLLPRQAGLRSI